MRVISTDYSCETPEGIALQAELAGPIPRILAYAIDIGVRTTAIIIFSTIFNFFGKTGWGLLLIITFAAEWFYPVLFEIFNNGQTPGKKAMGLRVVQDNLTPVSLGNSLTRNLLRAADFLPFMYAFGIVSMLTSRNFKRLGDLTAGTIVIHTNDSHLHSLEQTSSSEAEAPTVAFSTDEQLALCDYAERRATLSEARQLELAEVLTPVTKLNAKASREMILSNAAWLAGK